jgi:hypothetical protein
VPTVTSFPGRERVKSAEEIMNILEAYDLTGAFRDAGELAGCSHHTVARYFGIDRFISRCRVYVAVTEYQLGDMRRHPVHDGLGGTKEKLGNRRS